ncbi:MMPL family transporter [Candidatus Bipolaricaulota bacterium]|nr:MMPL family transporter [Candidatus Bipolaricaulota bacterium]
MRKFGELILKYRVLVVIAILGLTVPFLLHVSSLNIEADESTWFAKGDKTRTVYDEFKDRFASDEFVVVSYESDDPLSESEIAYLSYLTEKLETEVPYVDEAVSLTTVDDILGTAAALEVRPLLSEAPKTDEERSRLKERVDLNPFFKGNIISKDGTTIGIALRIIRRGDKPGTEISQKINAGLQEILTREHEDTGRRFYFGGSPITHANVTGMLQSDMRKFFPLSLLLTGIVLLVVFRSLPSVLFPLIAVFLSLIWTLGLKGLVGSPMTPVSTTLFALITVIGVANSVHLISHYRIELPVVKDKKEALLATYERAGKPCLFTSLTTAIGFGSLSVSHIPAIRNLGIFAGFGIMSAFLLSMILVPLGLQLAKGKASKKVEHRVMGRMLASIGRLNLSHPKLVLTVSLSIILAMGIGILRIHTEGSMLEYFKKGSGIRESAEFLDDRLAGISSTEVVVYGERDTFKEPQVLEKIDRLQKLANAHPKVSTSYSIIDYIKLINRALHGDEEAFYTIPTTKKAVAQSLLLYEFSGGSGIEDYVTRDYATARVSIRTKQLSEQEKKALLAQVEDYAAHDLAEFRVEVTGWNNMTHAVTESIVLTQIQSFGLSMLVITGLMIILFGLKGGLVSILPNTFPIVFVLGLMGHAGFSLNMATAIIASIAIGIVVDDTIHYFSHFRHEFQVTGDKEKAMVSALQGVGRALCFTSIILALGFGIFLFSGSSILVNYGILSGVAVITALLGDLFIGPVLLSKLRIFGKRTREQCGK